MEAQGHRPVLEALNGLQPRGKKQRHEVKKAIDYFTANAGRMDYPTYAAHHWPIGSGIVESTCRLVSKSAHQRAWHALERGWRAGDPLPARTIPRQRQPVARVLPTTAATPPTAGRIPDPSHACRHERR